MSRRTNGEGSWGIKTIKGVKYFYYRDTDCSYTYGKSQKEIKANTLNMVKVPLESKVAVKKYSLGMKQRLGIANALLGNPDVLIFDEPTNGLDPQGIMDVRNLIQRLNEEEGKTIIVSSHILSELQNTAHRFGMLYDGVVVKELDQDDLRVNADITSINVHNDDVEKATKVLQDAGIQIKGTEQAMTSLENYYFGLIEGGGDNA